MKTARVKTSRLLELGVRLLPPALLFAVINALGIMIPVQAQTYTTSTGVPSSSRLRKK
jgi:hypothetical protein